MTFISGSIWESLWIWRHYRYHRTIFPQHSDHCSAFDVPWWKNRSGSQRGNFVVNPIAESHPHLIPKLMILDYDPNWHLRSTLQRMDHRRNLVPGPQYSRLQACYWNLMWQISRSTKWTIETDESRCEWGLKKSANSGLEKLTINVNEWLNKFVQHCFSFIIYLIEQ